MGLLGRFKQGFTPSPEQLEANTLKKVEALIASFSEKLEPFIHAGVNERPEARRAFLREIVANQVKYLDDMLRGFTTGPGPQSMVNEKNDLEYLLFGLEQDDNNKTLGEAIRTVKDRRREKDYLTEALAKM